MTSPDNNKILKLKTERFLLRTCVASDASDRWIGWAADPEVMHSLNAPVTRFTPQELAGYIAGFNNEDRLLIGIFVNESGLHIGFYILEKNERHRHLAMNVVIGDKEWWGRKVVLESRAALLDHFFASGSVEKVFGAPISRNFPAVFNYKAQGWTLEGILRDHLTSARDGTRLDQFQFGMRRKDWLKLRESG
jgi:RimJ/RimL family protein N-acetyltransferase